MIKLPISQSVFWMKNDLHPTATQQVMDVKDVGVVG
jgi:hypothetical protein